MSKIKELKRGFDEGIADYKDIDLDELDNDPDINIPDEVIMKLIDLKN